MLKIAICDDEKVFRDNINKYVAAYFKRKKRFSYENRYIFHQVKENN